MLLIDQVHSLCHTHHHTYSHTSSVTKSHTNSFSAMTALSYYSVSQLLCLTLFSHPHLVIDTLSLYRNHALTLPCTFRLALTQRHRLTHSLTYTLSLPMPLILSHTPRLLSFTLLRSHCHICSATFAHPSRIVNVCVCVYHTSIMSFHANVVKFALFHFLTQESSPHLAPSFPPIPQACHRQEPSIRHPGLDLLPHESQERGRSLPRNNGGWPLIRLTSPRGCWSKGVSSGGNGLHRDRPTDNSVPTPSRPDSDWHVHKNLSFG